MESDRRLPSEIVSNVLSEEKQKQVIALGQLGWSLRRIEKATGVRRETAGGYLRAANIPVRPPGAWGKRPAGKPANGVTTDSAGGQTAKTGQWGDHRLGGGTNRKTGQCGDHRFVEHLGGLPRTDRRGSQASAECDVD